MSFFSYVKDDGSSEIRKDKRTNPYKEISSVVNSFGNIGNSSTDKTQPKVDVLFNIFGSIKLNQIFLVEII